MDDWMYDQPNEYLHAGLLSSPGGGGAPGAGAGGPEGQEQQGTEWAETQDLGDLAALVVTWVAPAQGSLGLPPAMLQLLGDDQR